MLPKSPPKTRPTGSTSSGAGHQHGLCGRRRGRSDRVSCTAFRRRPISGATSSRTCCRTGAASRRITSAWATRAAAPDGKYRFFDHQRYLDAWFDALGVTRNVILVVHDWGSALGFAWAQRHPERVKAIVYMEASFVRSAPGTNGPRTRGRSSRRKRQPTGEEMILRKNLFIEYLLPLRNIPAEALKVYRRYFAIPGLSRMPMLAWTRDLPIAGEPADVVAVVEVLRQMAVEKRDSQALHRCRAGGLSDRGQRDFCRAWPNQETVPVKGAHFLQEESPAKSVKRRRHLWARCWPDKYRSRAGPRFKLLEVDDPFFRQAAASGTRGMSTLPDLPLHPASTCGIAAPSARCPAPSMGMKSFGSLASAKSCLPKR